MSSAASVVRLPRQAADGVRGRLEGLVGGRARARVVIVLASVMGLESADGATVAAAAPQLKAALHISNSELGLLVTTSTLVGALVTVPAGALADRTRRVTLLAAAVACWGVSMVVTASAPDFTWLLLSRLGLGAITAVVGPTIASLCGDFFPAAERAKMYGYILSGELVGTGFGFAISGLVAGALSWHWAFALLAVAAALVTAVIWFRLPEPARGGQSHLEPGADEILDANGAAEREPQVQTANTRRRPRGLARRAVAARRVEPVAGKVLHDDPGTISLRRAVRYVLSIRTNQWLIGASAVGFFFFAGLRTFMLVFVRGNFSLSQASATAVLLVAGAGSLAGLLVAGRLADALIRRGVLNARVLVAGIGYIAAAVILLPGLLVTTLAVAVPLLVLAGALLMAPNPPLAAARLDIMPAQLWGRAEGVGTLVRHTAQAGAPLLFGVVADAFAGSGDTVGSHGAASAATAHGVGVAFLIMLIPLALSGIVLFAAGRSYPADVATAIASEQNTSIGERAT